MYCPWMLIALELLDKSDQQSILQQTYNVILSTWMNNDIHEGITRSNQSLIYRETSGG